jgi:hypothetical protein
MIAVQNLVELLDLPQDLLPHQVMEQFTHMFVNNGSKSSMHSLSLSAFGDHLQCTDWGPLPTARGENPDCGSWRVEENQTDTITEDAPNG